MTSERRKQEATHRLLSVELDFIDSMHAGMQRYSRPLRHCILSQQQHSALFQNIEKVWFYLILLNKHLSYKCAKIGYSL